MKLLTPQETLQAIIDGKGLECRWYASTEWKVFIPTEHPISTVHIFNGTFQFRLAQEMITIDGVSFPKPESKPPKQGSYYIASLEYDNFYAPSIWDGDALDKFRLKCGLVHLSKENAIAHTKALIKLSGGKVDE